MKNGSKARKYDKQIQHIEGLKDFFDRHTLEESRNALWKWLNVTGCRSFQHLDPMESENLLVFYSHLHGLLEAAHKIKVSRDKMNIDKS